MVVERMLVGVACRFRFSFSPAIRHVILIEISRKLCEMQLSSVRSEYSLEPWLSSCRAVEAPSSRCRGRCRGLACQALSSLSLCRVPVEPRQAPSRLTPCAGLSRSVELSSFCRVSLSRLSSL